MMKTLILMRHGDSPAHLDDFNREISPLGENHARAAANLLKTYRIDKALVSKAKRTLQTLEIVQDVNEIGQIETSDALYNHLENDYLALINKVTDDVSSLLIVGHNPAIHTLALTLAFDDEYSYNQLLEQSFPAAAFIVIEFTLASWQKIEFGTGAIKALFIPKNIT